MNELFQNVLTASFHGSIVIAVVILLRLVLKKTPKKFICLLWLLAGIRLLMPFQIQSSLSLQPETARVVAEQRWQQPEAAAEPAPKQPWENNVPEPENTTFVPADASAAAERFREAPGDVFPEAFPTEEDSPAVNWAALVPYFWFIVACCFVASSLYSYLRLRYLVREAVRIPGGWECENIETAFILGFIRPRIYIPMGMSPDNRKYIFAHEQTHLEKGDHWFKMIGYIALAIHWFNPLAWVAYTLLCKDIEMACDERVVQFMELEERKAYSAALLSCSTNRAHLAACPVAFGEVSVKYRIKSVLNYRKPGFWISLVGVLAVLFVAVCLLTNPAGKEGALAAGETAPSEESDVVAVTNIDELLAAIAPDTVIQLEAGTYNLTGASDYGINTGSGYYVWNESEDGYELELLGVENLTIRGSGKYVTVLETDPRFANVLRLRDCSNVTLEDFNAGHTKATGECSGGVVNLQNCSGVTMNRMGLYGCGIIGLQADQCREVALTDSDIYQCSVSAMAIQQCTDVSVSRCRIYDIGYTQYGGYTLFNVYDSEEVAVEDCEISNCSVVCLVDASGSRMHLKNTMFTGNRPKSAAFSLNGGETRMDNCEFRDNHIRNWYTPESDLVSDSGGNYYSAEALMKRFSTTVSEILPEAAQPRLEIHVSTVDELIAAIGPNTEIVLDESMYDLSEATGYGTSKGDYYHWEDVFDGPGLVIQNVDNLVIRSSDGNITGHTLSATPRYADVMTFDACTNIGLSGFTAGHTKEPGSCAGGVLKFRDSDGIVVDSCGLFGCGILGIQAEYCSDIRVVNCDIYECSQGGIRMWNTSSIAIEDCTLRELGGEAVWFGGCTGVTIDGEPPVSLDNVDQVKDQETTRLTSVMSVMELRETLQQFVRAYLRGDTDAMKACMAEPYDEDLPVYSGKLTETDQIWFSGPQSVETELVSHGSCTVCCMIRGSDSELSLFLRATKEQGVWKIAFDTE